MADKAGAPVSVKDAVYRLQNYLLDGITDEAQLFAAGSIMSRGDYEDVVAERSIINLCGYPLCRNPLPSDRPRKGRYRISLKEHKVYDLHETYMYCSPGCVVNSRTFAGSLQEERCSVLNPAKLDEVFGLFEGFSVEKKDELDGDFGMSKMKIQEKEEVKSGEVSVEQWAGPSNAIEGYVPQGERKPAPNQLKPRKEGTTPRRAKPDKSNLIINDFEFASTIIALDEYSISKLPPSLLGTASCSKSKESKEESSQVDLMDKSESREGTKPSKEKPDKTRLIINDFDFSSTIIAPAEYSISKIPLSSAGTASSSKLKESQEESSRGDSGDKSAQKHRISDKMSMESRGESECMSVVDVPSTSNACPPSFVEPIEGSGDKLDVGKVDGKLSSDGLRSSLKSAGAKKVNRSVTWADEKESNSRNGNLCDVRKMEDTEAGPSISDNADIEDEESLVRLSSAEACALALNQAAEAISSGKSDVSDAVSDAGLIILPPAHAAEESESTEDPETVEVDLAAVKWPKKPSIPTSDLFDSEDSWFDAPPEGFSLTLSPFATMWGALFSWITASSLAYIYGQDESFHEEYLSVNGREYPQKIVLADGRSSEIKQTLAGCLARALPGLVADLRLPIPISTLEQALGHLLDTMSFLDSLPSFRAKQWQVVLLLFVDALSVSRVPALTVHMTNRRALLHKVLDGAHIGVDEYEILKDLLIPLGRAPRFSAQSGA